MVRLTTHRRQRHRRAVQARSGTDVPLCERSCSFTKRESPGEGIRSSRSTKRSIDSSRPSFSPRSTNSRKCPGASDVQGLFGRVSARCERHGWLGTERECEGVHNKRGSIPASSLLPAPSEGSAAARPDHPRRTPPDLRATRHARRALRDSGQTNCRPGSSTGRRSVPRSSPPPPPPACRRAGSQPLLPPGRSLPAGGPRRRRQLLRSATLDGRRSRPPIHGCLRTGPLSTVRPHSRLRRHPQRSAVALERSRRRTPTPRRPLHDDARLLQQPPRARWHASTGRRRRLHPRLPHRTRRPAGPGPTQHEPGGTQELTSRIRSSKIPDLLDQLEVSFPKPTEKGPDGKWPAFPLDVVLATNMVSVGVDVQRLGLMVVSGQPKATAEYIQASSRVGRSHPGFVVTVPNWARPATSATTSNSSTTTPSSTATSKRSPSHRSLPVH